MVDKFGRKERDGGLEMGGEGTGLKGFNKGVEPYRIILLFI